MSASESVCTEAIAEPERKLELSALPKARTACTLLAPAVPPDLRNSASPACVSLSNVGAVALTAVIVPLAEVVPIVKFPLVSNLAISEAEPFKNCKFPESVPK